MSGITVIIPSHNRCALLMRALESIMKQTYPPDQMIVIDDGSTDDTVDQVNKHFPDVELIKQSNHGVSHARNQGIRRASGEWLAFLDSDDEWLPDKLQIQMTALEQQPEFKVCHTEEIWVRNGVRVNPMKKHKKTGGWIFQQCLPLCAMSPSSVLIHRSVFAELGNFDEDLPACEDYDLWLRITARFPVIFIETPQIVKYGGHEDQLSQKYWGMDRFRIEALLKILRQNILKEADKRAATEMLLKKCRIFKQGALKRDKTEQADYYQNIIDRYSCNV